MIEFNEVISFIRVVQARGFIPASRIYGTPKSTLSRHVLALEARLGVTLLHRSTRKITLTSEGETYYHQVVTALKTVEEAETHLHTSHKGLSGLIRLTAPVDFGTTILSGLLAKFLQLYPLINFDLLMTDRIVDLIGEQVDLAVRAGPLAESNLKHKKIYSETMAMVAAPDFLLKKGRPQHPEDLLQMDCLVFAPLARLKTWSLTNGRKSIDITPYPKIKLTSYALALELAKQGLGITLVPSFMFQDFLKMGELEKVLPEWHTEKRPIHLVWPQQTELPYRVQLFKDFIQNELKIQSES